jgi:hypothetical protein
MSPVDVRPRRASLRAAARRRPGGSDRRGGQARPEGRDSLRLFGEGGGAVVEPPADAEGAPRVRREAADPAEGGEGATLEQLIGRLWEEVLAEGAAACPVCGGEMVGRASAHARPTEGCCRQCGTTIG